MSNTPTPHISCNPGDFAKTVLMPGDPLRAEFIANTFLTDAKLVNNVRGIHGYTGLYKGKPVSQSRRNDGIIANAMKERVPRMDAQRELRQVRSSRKIHGKMALEHRAPERPLAAIRCGGSRRYPQDE